MNRNGFLTVVLCVVAAALSVVGASSVAKAGYLYSEDANLVGYATGNFAQYTLGNVFKVGPRDLVVTSVGYADLANGGGGSPGDGLADSHEVGLWQASNVGTDVSNVTFLTSVTVPSGTGATLVNNFRYQAIGPITLSANTWYVLGGNTGSTAPTANDSYRYGVPFTPSPDLDPTIRLYARVQTPEGAGFAYPNTSGMVGEVWGSVNMQYTVAPEPSTLALLSTALFGLLAYIWRKRNKLVISDL